MGVKGKGKRGKGVSRESSMPRRVTRKRGPRDHGGVHRKVEDMGYWRCVACNGKLPVGTEVPGRVLLPGRHLILCSACGVDWVYYPARKYLRRREFQVKWLGQSILASSVVKIFGSSYVVNELKMVEWGISLKGGFLSFDLAVPARNLLIDYHGEQHYNYPNRWHRTRAAFEEQRTRDAAKYILAEENGWSYIVFSYNEPVDNEAWVRDRLGRVLGNE